MNKNFFLGILFLFFYNIAFGKYSKGVTTEEEYLYMSKGYKVAQESGLDIKSGYAIGKTIAHTVGIYTFEYKAFLKVNGSDTIEVGTIVKVTAKTLFGVTTAWFGIPKGNTTLLNQFFTSLYTSSTSYAEPFFKSYAAIKEIDNF